MCTDLRVMPSAGEGTVDPLDLVDVQQALAGHDHARAVDSQLGGEVVRHQAHPLGTAQLHVQNQNIDAEPAMEGWSDHCS